VHFDANGNKAARHGGMARIGIDGHYASVSARAAANFQGFLDDLKAHGYPIKFIGGWRAHGSCKGCDMHPRGLAIDVNQKRRDVVTVPLSRALAHKLAQAHGLVSGGDWCNGDLGHFELASASRANYDCRGTTEFLATRHHRNRRGVHVASAAPDHVDVAARPAYPTN
jgi:hypothetical protein